jgi:hypothetical protein
MFNSTSQIVVDSVTQISHPILLQIMQAVIIIVVKQDFIRRINYLCIRSSIPIRDQSLITN